jgi:hypothetical protein
MFERADFRYLEFAMERVQCPSSIGAPIHRWIRHGMPRLNPQLSDCVFYLYGINPKTGKVEGPLGTGSIVGRPSQADGSAYNLYGVTNWHVALERGASIIRLNTHNGKTRFLRYELTDWQFIPRHDDIAAIDLADDLSQTTDEIMFIGEKQFISREILEQFGIWLGEDVFMIGLYVNQDGGARNIPCGRFGNLSMVANEQAPIEQPNKMMRPSHLVDMRSRSGFSGSPVFVYRIPEADLSRPPFPLDSDVTYSKHGIFAEPSSDLRGRTTIKDHLLGLLGIHCSQFLEPTKVAKSPNQSKERIGDPINEGDDLYIPGSMNIVIPAWCVTELLDLDIFERARQKREPAFRRAMLKRPQAEAVALPESDKNSSHREDFTALLDTAVRKPQSKD